MAHEQQRAAEFHEQILQQLQRLRIEIVRRLVEHEHVARFREESRKQQAVPLAARQRLDRGARPRRIEEKIFEVGNHVPRLAIDRHRRIAVRHRILHAQRLVELCAQLVEIDHLQPRALLDRADRAAEPRGLAALGDARLGEAMPPLGLVRSGIGNGFNNQEGVWHGNVFGSYMHGPVLARNPELADAVLQCAIGPMKAFDDPLAQAFAKERRITLGGIITNS